ncbi:hypothetical protein [Catellatospora tritici]|uniref:hypothetical protein n=1 Tax=Catellatospora tritici TaxID=2851566 RepID=UPI001C2D5312|nr:hypothetical protein [Catellatospora tritici]MBV1854860.1 hypothetical protein [Catellatospora tritici]
MLREQCGWFELHVTVPDEDRVRLVKRLRGELKLSLPEAARLLSLKTGPLVSGLEIEMRRVEAIVRSAVPHAVTAVRRVHD